MEELFTEWLINQINNKTGKPYASAKDGIYALKKAPEKYGMDLNIFDITEAEVVDIILAEIVKHPEHKHWYNHFGNGQFNWGLKKYKEFLIMNNIEQENIEIENQTKDKIGYNKTAFILARVGQGDFREAVLIRCNKCPFTGIENQSLLIASHIKPWKNSDDKEKVDGQNGFALTPTYDKLFDAGYISFSNDGKLILSQYLSDDICTALNLNNGDKIQELKIGERTKIYLEFHRNNVFKRDILVKNNFDKK